MWIVSVTKKNLLCACLVAVSLILGYIEHVFLPLPFFGLKIGLSNLPVIFILYYSGARYAYATGVFKAVLSGLIFSGFMSILYSLLGIILSVTGMVLVRKIEKITVYGVSVAGSALFQIGQTVVACVMLSSDAPLYYLAYLLMGSVPCGIVSAILVKGVGSRLQLFKEHKHEIEFKS